MKRFLIGFIAALVFSSVFPLTAQEPAPCNGLDEAACQLWQTAVANTRAARDMTIPPFTMEGSLTTDQGISEFSLGGVGYVRLAEDGSLEALALQTGGMLGGTYQEGEIRWVDEQLFFGMNNDWITPASSGNDNALQALITGDFVASIFTEPGVLTFQRIEDEEDEGQVMVVLQGTGAFSAFLATPSAAQWLELLVQALPVDQRASLESVTGDDIGSVIRLLVAFATADQIETIIWIGTDDQLIHHIELAIEFEVQAPQEGTFGLSLDAAVHPTDHGKTVTITAPEEYREEAIELNALMNELLQFSEVVGQSTDPSVNDGTLVYGDTLTGTLAQDNPEDRWGFTAQAGEVITITLRAVDISTGLDTVLHLIGPNGAELTSNDDHESDDETLDVFDSQIVEFTLSEAGDYQIIATWQSEIRGAADYELTLELVE